MIMILMMNCQSLENVFNLFKNRIIPRPNPNPVWENKLKQQYGKLVMVNYVTLGDATNL